MKKIYTKRKNYIFSIFFIGLIFGGNAIQSQNVVLNVPEWKDYYRREQLFGRMDQKISFLNLPLHFNDTIKKGLSFELMPFVFQQQYTSKHPMV